MGNIDSSISVGSIDDLDVSPIPGASEKMDDLEASSNLPSFDVSLSSTSFGPALNPGPLENTDETNFPPEFADFMNSLEDIDLTNSWENMEFVDPLEFQEIAHLFLENKEARSLGNKITHTSSEHRECIYALENMEICSLPEDMEVSNSPENKEGTDSVENNEAIVSSENKEATDSSGNKEATASENKEATDASQNNKATGASPENIEATGASENSEAIFGASENNEATFGASGNKEATASENKEATSSSNNEVEILHTRPTICGLEEKEVLSLKKTWGSEKYPKRKEKYFEKLKSILINIYKNQEPRVVFNHFKKNSRIAYFLPELMLFIFTELGKRDLKPLLLLKAFYFYFSHDEIIVEKEDSTNTKCNTSLKKYLTKSVKPKTLRYLLKDITADILSEFGCTSLSDTAVKLFTHDFRYLKEGREDIYGSIIAWLSNVTPETGFRLIRAEAEYSDKLALRALNSSKMLRRLISVCESCVCCVPCKVEDVPLTETDSLPKRQWEDLSSKDTNNVPKKSQSQNLSLVETNNVFSQSNLSLMEIDSLPSESEHVISIEPKLLYDPTLVTLMNNLIRHETIYTPTFHIEYEGNTSKPFDFSDLILQTLTTRMMSLAGVESAESDEESETEDASYRPEDIQEDTSEDFYVTEPSSSYINDPSFWGSWDIFSNIVTPVDSQSVFFGNASPVENIFDIYSCEKANICHMSTCPSNFDPLNAKTGQTVFNPFTEKLPDKNIQFRKASRKRKLSPSA